MCHATISIMAHWSWRNADHSQNGSEINPVTNPQRYHLSLRTSSHIVSPLEIAIIVCNIMSSTLPPLLNYVHIVHYVQLWTGKGGLDAPVGAGAKYATKALTTLRSRSASLKSLLHRRQTNPLVSSVWGSLSINI